MRVREAVVLAAGMGTRLKELGRQTPKGFLQLGEKPIIEESLARLRRAGIERVTIVTGHLSEFYESLRAAQGDFVHTVHNPRFADSGSMYSLYLARVAVTGDFLLLESDLIYEQRALMTLLEHAREELVLLSGETRSGDEVYVETNDGMLVNMSKRREALGPHIAGELVGICRLSAKLYAAMNRYAAAHFEKDLRLDYETDCLVGVARDMPVYCPVVPDLLWSEIDDENHLTRARERIYPAIRARD